MNLVPLGSIIIASASLSLLSYVVHKLLMNDYIISDLFFYICSYLMYYMVKLLLVNLGLDSEVHVPGKTSLVQHFITCSSR